MTTAGNETVRYDRSAPTHAPPDGRNAFGGLFLWMGRIWGSLSIGTLMGQRKMFFGMICGDGANILGTNMGH